MSNIQTINDILYDTTATPATRLVALSRLLDPLLSDRARARRLGLARSTIQLLPRPPVQADRPSVQAVDRPPVHVDRPSVQGVDRPSVHVRKSTPHRPAIPDSPNQGSVVVVQATTALRNAGLDQLTAARLTAAFPPDRITSVIAAARQVKPHNPPGWIRRALEHGWLLPELQPTTQPRSRPDIQRALNQHITTLYDPIDLAQWKRDHPAALRAAIASVCTPTELHSLGVKIANVP
jgi:hypothetical protein